MKKTLLLCYIHGFKGGESTFGHNYAFTHDLGRQVAKALPRINVQVSVYPKFETRGDLASCVNRFREWLLNKVIDIEVAAATPSPTIDSSVRVILVGHSMGGIVAAETAILVASERPIHGSGPDPADDKDIGGGSSGNGTQQQQQQQQETSPTPSSLPPPNSNMFPYIQGVLAFDTPFLGISPGVVAHGAESHYSTASSAIAQLSSLTGLWGGAKTAEADDAASSSSRKAPVGALPAPPVAAEEASNSKKKPNSASSSSTTAASTGGGGSSSSSSSWGNWGKIAMVAGAVGAVAAGSAAAYYNRENINAGWTWATSHLEFVGCLARKEELRRRVAYMVRLRSDLGVGFANLYTRLGPSQAGVAGVLMDGERTFCVVPRREAAGDWVAAQNGKASDETVAHMTMFEPKENPEYEKLVRDAANMVASWLQNDWYRSSLENVGP